MKKCKICNDWPVSKGSGLCMKHHKIWIKKRRELKKNFIEFMRLKEKYKLKINGG